MNSNTSLKEIGNVLKSSGSILIYPHVNADGDAVGSASALCGGLRSMGKEAWVVLDEKIPGYINFVDTSWFTGDNDIVISPDVCVCVDCSEESRILGREGAYRAGKRKICIDHHLAGENVKNSGFADDYYIDSKEAAAAQIIYKLLKEMETEITAPIAEALYCGIVTDTGRFQYSNTTCETHMIAAELFKAGIDQMKIMVSLYQNVSLNRIMLQNRIMDTLEIFCGGKAAAVYVTQNMLKELSAEEEDAEGAIDAVRNIEGVEIALFLKERDGRVKASMRAKSYGRVDGIAASFGGGGHMKAAGCTFDVSISRAKEILMREIEKYLENL